MTIEEVKKMRERVCRGPQCGIAAAVRAHAEPMFEL
jgi:hypothetical protein